MANLSGGGTLRGDLLTVLREGNDAERLLIGLEVAPAYGVSTLAGQYPKFTLDESKLLNSIATERAPGAEYGQVVRNYERAVYDCLDYGLTEYVDRIQAADQARFFDAEVEAARSCELNVRLAHERRVAALLFGSDFSASAALVAYTQANLATIDFAGDVQGALETLTGNGVMPNAVVISGAVWNRVTRSTLFQNFLKPYAAGVSVVTRPNAETAFAEAFGIPGFRVLIGRGSYNTSKTSTASMSKIWGNTHFWVGKLAGGDPRAGGAMRTFAFEPGDGVLAVRSYDEDKRKSVAIEVAQQVDEAVIEAAAGVRITTSYA